jgi:superoxide dismutase
LNTERSRAVLYELPPLPYPYGALEPHVDYLEAWRNVVNWPRAVEPLAGAGGRHPATV